MTLNMMKLATTIFALLISLPNVGGTASAFQSLEEIRQAAKDFTEATTTHTAGQRTSIEVGYLDERLKLTPCDIPLSAKPLSGSRGLGRTTVTVSCEGSVSWSIHVQVNIQAFAPVVIATSPLPRKQAIDAQSLTIEERDIASLRSGFFSDPSAVSGRLPKRTIHAGMVVAPHDLTTIKLIRKGHRVTIQASTGGISVTMQGKALDDGGKGDVIRVQNLSSKKTIEATVIAPGLVTVNM